MFTLSLDNLSIGYGTYVVQSSLDLSLSGGQMVCMLGKNGCGKSTLLRTMAGLQPALGGKVRLLQSDGGQTAEQDLVMMSQSERARYLSLVLTERESMESTRVREIVAMGRFPYTNFMGKLTREDQHEIDRALESVGLVDKADHYFNRLSDGEKQRVLIAKALAQTTPLILLDEPTAHLDLINRIKIMLMLSRMAHEQNKIVIVSTHELDLALQIADRLWLMTPGCGVETGTAEQLTTTGAFQRAFADESFSFVSNNQQLSVVVNKG